MARYIMCMQCAVERGVYSTCHSDVRNKLLLWSMNTFRKRTDCAWDMRHCEHFYDVKIKIYKFGAVFLFYVDFNPSTSGKKLRFYSREIKTTNRSTNVHLITTRA